LGLHGSTTVIHWQCDVKNPGAIRAHTATSDTTLFSRCHWFTGFLVEELLENPPLAVDLRREDNTLTIGCPGTRVIPAFIER
jgi:hypothetical protein